MQHKNQIIEGQHKKLLRQEKRKRKLAETKETTNDSDHDEKNEFDIDELKVNIPRISEKNALIQTCLGNSGTCLKTKNQC